MLKKGLCIFSIFLFGAFSAHSQNYPALSGARAAALGQANVTLGGIWSIRNNIGALAGLDVPEVAFGYQTRFQLQELSTLGALLAWPLNNGVAGAAFSRYGTGLYSIQSVGLGYSHKISYISVGIKLNYVQQSIETAGSRGNMVLELGGKAELLPTLHFAAHVYNVSQSRVAPEQEELLPTILTAGLAFLPTDKLELYVQTRKNVEFAARFSAGLEYRLIPEVKIRTGIQTKPVEAGFGFGLLLRRINVDYAFQHNNTIGAAHHLSVGFILQKQAEP